MNKKKAIVTSIILSSLVFMISLIVIPNTVKAKDNVIREKQIISVKVEEGDTLWSIAKEYYTRDYKDVKSYIKEIKRANGLSTDTIHEGRYLVVPCYVGVQ